MTVVDKVKEQNRAARRSIGAKPREGHDGVSYMEFSSSCARRGFTPPSYNKYNAVRKDWFGPKWKSVKLVVL